MTEEERKLKAEHAYVDAYYEDNTFRQANPKAFFVLWKLMNEHPKDWAQQLSDNLLYYRAKRWCQDLWEAEDPAAVKTLGLQLPDIVKLVMNNVTKLPGMKCKLKELQASAAQAPCSVS